MTGTVVYTPPEGEPLLRALLANWEQFLHNAEHLDPLIRMAVAHYQFEAIHPFTDGNGRTGRIFNLLFLVEQDLLRPPILYRTTARIRTIQERIDETTRFVRTNAFGAYSRELVDLTFVQPYCRITNVIDAGIARCQTAASYLKQLVQVGVLEEVKAGREKLFVNTRLMRLLTAEAPGDLAP